MTRRSFVRTAACTALSYSRILGANNRIRMGFIGTGGMGYYNIKACQRQLNTEVTMVCDVYDASLQKAMTLAPRAKPTKYFPEVLDDKELDAICVSTPDHWHAYMAIESMKRGKHLFVEKPIAHSVNEAVMMIRAARKYGVVTQVDQWQRSDDQFRAAIEYVQSGILGPIRTMKTWLYWKWGGIGNPPDGRPPAGLGDWGWDMFLGPAPWRLFNQNRFMFNWRWFWDTGNGIPADWGPHTIDIMLWALRWDGVNKSRLKVNSAGQINCEELKDNRETPLVFNTFFTLTDGKVFTFDYNGCDEVKDANTKQGRNWGMQWFGENGSVFVDRERGVFEIKDAGGNTVPLKSEVKTSGHPQVEHWRDFVNAVRNGRTNTRASLERVGQTNIACLLAVAAYKYGRPIVWDPVAMQTPDKQARKFLEFHYREPWKLRI